jgi:23S rRNA (adenine2030-N6)-methyltransferase
VLLHLRTKDKPFLALDAHAGIGIYDLKGLEALKTQEWQSGVGRLTQPLEDAAAENLLEPWRMALSEVNPAGELQRYPGSPEIFRLGLREADRLVVNELHPQDAESLRSFYSFDRRLRITSVDARGAVKANLPPAQRRGVILIDPPYEQSNEVEHVVLTVKEAIRRFSTGIYLVWFPLTGDGLDARLVEMVQGLSLPRLLKLQLVVRVARFGSGLAGSGLLIVNPPWQLDEEMRVLLPALAQCMAQDAQAKSTIEILAGEDVSAS